VRATLVRVGVDQSFGAWNAPVDPDTYEFVYVPIPEAETQTFHDGLATSYRDVVPALKAFAASRCSSKIQDVTLPQALQQRYTHQDPDFGQLTYGDNGTRRGKVLGTFEPGDLVAFFAGLRPCRACPQRLIYAIIGAYRVGEVARLADVPRARWSENAHTRRGRQRPDDVIVRADPRWGGRLRSGLPIGEWRDRAYRVRRDLLEEWGGLSVRNGFIQRSAVPPTFNDPSRFLAWFERQAPHFVWSNNL
jgi:putative DNA base modification enzyme with NMAD domain